MGLLDRLIHGVNRVAAPLQGALTPTDPRLARTAELERDGLETSGTIVGVARTFDSDLTRTVFALEVTGSSTTGAQRFATEVTTTPHLHRLRLGLIVPVRLAGDRGVIDWAVLSRMWDLADGRPGQRARREAPANGVIDRAVDHRAQKLLERGRRTTATVTGLDRVAAMGTPTLNWDVHLQLDDGTPVVRRKDEVPPYAWWIAAPGATVPVAVDEGDPGAVAVDWAAATMAATTGPIHLHDQPPTGSIAAQAMAAAAPAGLVMGVGPADPVETIAAHRDAVQVVGTLREWVGEVAAGRMKPKAFRKHVAEWEAAGLCSPQEAAAARAAAGLDP